MNFQIHLLWVLSALILVACSKEEIVMSTSSGPISSTPERVPLLGNLNMTTFSKTSSDPYVNIIRGTGNLTHLGRVNFIIIQKKSSTSLFSGIIEFTSEYGDQLKWKYTGMLTKFDQQTLAFTSEYNWAITGGTGLFEDAEGNGKSFNAGIFTGIPPGPENIISFQSKIQGMISPCGG